MPSEWHDAFVRLIKERPADLITDNMILVGPEGSPVRAVIVEVQSDEKQSKRRQIPRYAMATWLRHKCPVDVLVLCPDEKTATWYAEPLPTALDDCLYRPKPLLPSRVPAVRDRAAVAADPAMAILSIIYHGQEPAVAEAFATGIADLGPEQGDAYYEYANALSPQLVRDILEVIVSTTEAPRYSAFAKRHYAEGERRTIRMVLKARGLTLTEEQAGQIEACDDLDTLKKWSEAALTAEDPGDIFR